MILIATQNQGKLNEYRKLLKPHQIISLKQLKSFPQNFKVKETGHTFKQNAIIKAKAYGQKTNLPSLADDSGLSIDHLKGFPGVKSARFAKGNYPAANQKILKLLKDLPKSKRTASFKIAIAIFNPQTKKLKTITAQTNGWIAFKVRGKNGFGYDPIFVSSTLNKTFAEFTQNQKNKLSHRAKALKQLTPKVLKELMLPKQS